MISAKVVLDSASWTRLITLELVYPRIILAEFNTHRNCARNTSSSRAIPVKTLVKQIWNSGFVPQDMRQNQSGMQGYSKAKHELANRVAWRLMTAIACGAALGMSKLGLHKQHVNRWLEPAMWCKTVATSTLEGWHSLLEQRDHEAAQPEFQQLAKQIRLAIEGSVPRRPELLSQPLWHLPYVGNRFGVSNDDLLESAGRCAGVSYYKTDAMSREDAIKIAKKMLRSKPMHASPFEHVAVSHVGLSGVQMGPFRHWTTLRHHDRLVLL